MKIGATPCTWYVRIGLYWWWVGALGFPTSVLCSMVMFDGEGWEAERVSVELRRAGGRSLLYCVDKSHVAHRWSEER
jgi:hypothetical protein